MQTIILAGGQSTRLHSDRPKALSKIAGIAIIDRLIGLLAAQGLKQISIALGSKQQAFVDHFEMPVQQVTGSAEYRQREILGSKVELRLLDTGANCDTGGRLGRLSELLTEPFVLCWCDALWDADINQLAVLHTQHQPLVTLLAVHPPGRFGRLELDDTSVTGFVEKPLQDQEWINGGLFIMQPEILNYIDGDHCSLERDVLPKLALEGKLRAHKHGGFWHCMDTPADQLRLDQIIRSGKLS